MKRLAHTTAREAAIAFCVAVIAYSLIKWITA